MQATFDRPLAGMSTAMLHNVINRGKYSRFEDLETSFGATIGELLHAELRYRTLPDLYISRENRAIIRRVS